MGKIPPCLFLFAVLKTDLAFDWLNHPWQDLRSDKAKTYSAKEEQDFYAPGTT
ncbi:MAG: hypothetical protein J1D88_08485 [Treponema sp.]|nr:hypothetical protein [Treponema sp.]